MPTVKVVDVLDQAAYMLTDEGHTRWTQEKLLAWFNEAQRALAARRPDSSSVSEAFSCAAGAKQALPSSGNRLLDIFGEVTQIPRANLDHFVPGWQKEEQTTDIEHFVYDDRDPKTFYVYPPAEAGATLEILYSKTPTEALIGNIDSDTIAFDDSWANALQEYILYRAWTKDAEFAGNANRAQLHQQAWRQAVGDLTQAEVATSPNAESPNG